MTDIFVDEYTCWVTWPPGEFDVEIRYLSPIDRDKLVKQCTVRNYDRVAKQVVETSDDQKFKRKLSDLIINWKGLTAGKLRKFGNINPKLKDSDEMPCTPELKLELIDRLSAEFFSTWVMETSLKLHEHLQKKTEEEEKN